jgi:putative colanic acid biosynthesis acetyltransferase WcaB
MMHFFCDWKRNRLNIKGRIILILFRVANKAHNNKIYFVLLLPYLIFYKLLVEWLLGVEVPWKTSIGEGLIIYHGYSLVINDKTIIGSNCTLRHCVTIGNKQLEDGTYSKSPIIGNNVDIGANVCIIGPLKIGDNVKIGAGSVVVKNVPSNSTVAGNPAKVIKYINPSSEYESL